MFGCYNKCPPAHHTLTFPMPVKASPIPTNAQYGSTVAQVPRIKFLGG